MSGNSDSQNCMSKITLNTVKREESNGKWKVLELFDRLKWKYGEEEKK